MCYVGAYLNMWIDVSMNKNPELKSFFWGFTHSQCVVVQMKLALGCSHVWIAGFQLAELSGED